MSGDLNHPANNKTVGMVTSHRNGDFGDDWVYQGLPHRQWCFFLVVFPRRILWGPQVRCPFGLGFPRRFSYGSYGPCRLCASKDVTALVYDGSDKPSVGDSDGPSVAEI